MNINNIGNEYAAQLGKLYEQTPKAVFAAIAYSFADRLDGEAPTPNRIAEMLVEEWLALSTAGIIPQKPPKGIFLCTKPS